MSGLSSEQTESLAMFKSVTSISSEEDARRRLEAASWDLQVAVERFLSGEPASGAGATLAPPAPQNVSSALTTASGRNQASRSATTESREEQPQRRRFRGFFRVIFFPIWLVISIAQFIGDKLSRLVRGPPAIESAPTESESQAFTARFEHLYSANHPTFFDGSLYEALAAAEAHFQFLLVFLHSELHPISADFCRRVFNSTDLIRFIDDNFIVWARRINTPEGYNAQNALGVSTFPFLAIVRSLRGRPNGQTLSVLEGRMDSERVQRWLHSVLERFGGSLTRARIESEERSQSRSLREQQDREYHETLEADRRRELEERDAERKAAEEEQQRQDAIQAEKRKLEMLAERRFKKSQELGKEPEKGPGVTSIVLRLPDGTRVDRRFRLEDTVRVIFDWADIQGVSIEHAALVSSFPRKVLLYPEDADQTLEEAGLSQGTMLLIEERSDL